MTNKECKIKNLRQSQGELLLEKESMIKKIWDIEYKMNLIKENLLRYGIPTENSELGSNKANVGESDHLDNCFTCDSSTSIHELQRKPLCSTKRKQLHERRHDGDHHQIRTDGENPKVMKTKKYLPVTYVDEDGVIWTKEELTNKIYKSYWWFCCWCSWCFSWWCFWSCQFSSWWSSR